MNLKNCVVSISQVQLSLLYQPVPAESLENLAPILISILSELIYIGLVFSFQ